jgi:hypothetical protein
MLGISKDRKGDLLCQCFAFRESLKYFNAKGAKVAKTTKGTRFVNIMPEKNYLKGLTWIGRMNRINILSFLSWPPAYPVKIS